MFWQILAGDDIILCQITSKFKKDKFSIELRESDFSKGGLPVQSYIRTNRIFTADKKIVIRKAGSTNETITDLVIQKLVELLIA